jgi:PadR family transcriptional regulator, regulatory protein AphA
MAIRAARAAETGVTRERRTRYVVLGMLAQGPANGYALRQRIEASVGNFWQESFGQLYPTLKELSRSGLVTSSAEKGARKGARSYAITASGKLALRQWLARGPQPVPERNELLLKVFFAALSPAEVRAHVLAARADAQRTRAQLRQMRASLRKALATHPSWPAWVATIDYGIIAQRALEAWCTRTAQAVATMESGRG